MMKYDIKGHEIVSMSWLTDYKVYANEIIKKLDFIGHGVHTTNKIQDIIFNKVRESIMFVFFNQTKRLFKIIKNKKKLNQEECNKLSSTLFLLWADNPDTSKFITFPFDNPWKIKIGNQEGDMSKLRDIIKEDWMDLLLDKIYYKSNDTIYPMIHIFNIYEDYLTSLDIEKKHKWVKIPDASKVGEIHIEGKDLKQIGTPFVNKDSFPSSVQFNLGSKTLWYIDGEGKYRVIEKNYEDCTYQYEREPLFVFDYKNDSVLKHLSIKIPGKWFLNSKSKITFVVYKLEEDKNPGAEKTEYLAEIKKNETDRIFVSCLELENKEKSLRKHNKKVEAPATPLF